jgi:ParB family chromosome partitioning protein
MQLEFHQLERRWEHLRVREPHGHRRLLASLADSGQQTPIVVVVCPDNRGRYLVIDGYKRIAALQQLGRDTVQATVWEMSEVEALVLSRSLRFSPQESALEQGWLLSEMEQRFGCSREELARRFDRSASWVSRRLALVELLPEAVQRLVREGKIAAQVAMKYLVPVARIHADHCERMAAALVAHGCDARQAGQLYAAWRQGTRTTRERILNQPELFLKTQRQRPAEKPAAVEQIERDLEMAIAILRRAGRQLTEAMAEMNEAQQEQTLYRLESARREAVRMTERMAKQREEQHAKSSATNRNSGTEREGHEQTRDRACAGGLASDRAQSSAVELHPRAGNPADGEGGALPATDPRSFGFVQGESRASP